jgi:hypothetical protein
MTGINDIIPRMNGLERSSYEASTQLFGNVRRQSENLLFKGFTCFGGKPSLFLSRRFIMFSPTVSVTVTCCLPYLKAFN